MSERPIIDWPVWLVSPPGRYALAWEQALFDQWVGDLFGYHALQLGRPELDTLRENRMPYRGLVLPAARGPEAPTLMTKAASDTTDTTTCATAADGTTPIASEMVARDILVSRFDELPIATASTDLVVLPHVLEFAENPHDILREVERILVPEGQVIITGFNNLSLWGAREELGRLAGAPFLPPGRRPHRLHSSEGLAQAAVVRHRPWPLRVLPAAAARRSLAATLRVHGVRRRSLVADLRRLVRGSRGEACAWHALGRQGPQAYTRAPARGGAGGHTEHHAPPDGRSDRSVRLIV
ncbi:SAM-dependent methyltransferase [Pandoraea pnomenusa]|uniref:SAM-dependent methyltransferase n=1 Tax=Pandoraea pnomenusa TaxID=93220 RepID=A0ABY6WLR8_9BURK|nr:SAM-dependent methyltransferase [Pandoraea pnomenusa]